MTEQNVRHIGKSNSTSRRDFLKSTVAAVAAAGSTRSFASFLPALAETAEKRKKVVIAAPPLGVRSTASRA